MLARGLTSDPFDEIRECTNSLDLRRSNGSVERESAMLAIQPDDDACGRNLFRPERQLFALIRKASALEPSTGAGKIQQLRIVMNATSRNHRNRRCLGPWDRTSAPRRIAKLHHSRPFDKKDHAEG